ncbi:MAG TPA: metal-dependent hydrolase [Vicinamibacterales bacterium]|nr:metal-dependent hydrolase [Vicinamibacterales bacterium]
MPSPIGHALAGLAAAWTADLIPGDRAWRTAPATAPFYLRAGDGLTLLCAGLGAAPDLDLAFIAHRTVTHSIGAVFFVGLFAAALAANAKRPIARIALMCAAAYGSHLFLDWLGTDFYPPRGIQLMWPINSEWYISGIDVFRQTARLRVFTHGPMMTNIRAVLQEIAILGPTVVALWLVRVKALAGLPPQVTRRDHPPQ